MVVATKVTQNRRRSETFTFKPFTVGAGSSLRFLLKLNVCRELELVFYLCVELAEFQNVHELAGDNVENVGPR
jgi:hypothetical protein